MKKIIHSLFKSLIFFPMLVVGQSSPSTIVRKTYDKLDNVKIDKVVYYQTPYAIYGNKPVETDYLPYWYWGYCATSYPLAFKNYVTEANSFILPPKSFSEKELKDYETKFKNLKIEDLTLPYVYCYGEIYLTDKKTKKTVYHVIEIYI